MHTLTAQDRDSIEQARLAWAAQAFSTAPIDRQRAEAAMLELYALASLPAPQFKWVRHAGAMLESLPRFYGLYPASNSLRSPGNAFLARELCRPLLNVLESLAYAAAMMNYWGAVNDILGRRGAAVTWSRNVRRLASGLLTTEDMRIGVGPMWARECILPSPMARYDIELLEFFASSFGRRLSWIVRMHVEVARACHWVVPRAKTCVMLERPTRVCTDEAGEFHCADGPALAYGKLWQLWAWHGTVVPAVVIERPERISLELLQSMSRETAYTAIERLGAERFLRKFGAVKFHTDQTGTLWHRRMQTRRDGWTWACVQVRNGTPGPDGRFEQYFLTVPANVLTARAAVAWTYGMREREYRVAVRT